MRTDALLLVLAAAAIHASWNALTKRAQDQLAFLWSSVSLATVVLLPVGWAWLPPDGVPRAAWPFLVASSAIHAVYFYVLGRAYGSGEFSLVYPIARGLGVALVPVAALFVLDERPSPLGALGVLLVVAGIVGINLSSAGLSSTGLSSAGRGAAGLGAVGLGAAASSRRLMSAGTGWALVTGLSIAAYSLVDKAGVARLHPVPYIAILGVGMSLLLVPALVRRRAALAREWRTNWRAILVASTLNLTSYLLVLFAFRLSKAGYVVAAREISIVLSVAIGRLWFGERRVGRRLAAATLVLAGVICVALAR
jgi:drug/metabolite transporter (DMT)-like permease